MDTNAQIATFADRQAFNLWKENQRFENEGHKRAAHRGEEIAGDFILLFLALAVVLAVVAEIAAVGAVIFFLDEIAAWVLPQSTVKKWKPTFDTMFAVYVHSLWVIPTLNIVGGLAYWALDGKATQMLFALFFHVEAIGIVAIWHGHVWVFHQIAHLACALWAMIP